ncbi:MAG: adenylate/guanylate cyclase domain-containing protein [Bauldia sp.]
MRSPPLILVVDDVADNRAVLRARLESQGYRIAEADGGETALAATARDPPDLVLLDVMMPGMDGIETVRALRARPSPFIPVILLTARSDNASVIAGLDAGADEYLIKPVDHAALVARVRAALRLKALQDAVADQADRLSKQAAELAAWNGALEERVADQLREIERMRRLRSFLAPQVVDAILASPDGESALASHRREVAVLFCDLRGFTAFAATAEPEDLIGLLRDYHAVVGELVFRHAGTLERFTGDAVMVLFNDPLPAPDFCRSAVRLATDIRDGLQPLIRRWRVRGAEVDVGIGIAAGFATLGKVGFRDRYDYAAIGPVTNLASRLSGYAAPGQILVTARVAEELSDENAVEPLGLVDLKGMPKPVPVFALRSAALAVAGS